MCAHICLCIFFLNGKVNKKLVEVIMLVGRAERKGQEEEKMAKDHLYDGWKLHFLWSACSGAQEIETPSCTDKTYNVINQCYRNKNKYNNNF